MNLFKLKTDFWTHQTLNSLEAHLLNEYLNEEVDQCFLIVLTKLGDKVLDKKIRVSKHTEQ